MDNESNITDTANSLDSNSTNSADESTSPNRSKRWRTSLPLIRNGKRKTPPLEPIPSAENFDNITDTATPVAPQDDKPKNMELVEYRGNTKRGWHTIVTIVLVEAKGLPEPPDDSAHHSLYCKFRLGSESQKSKSVVNNTQPEWGERFQLHMNKDQILKVSLWDKGKQKNFMGSCVIDLSTYEKERTHEVWQELDDGFGTVHLSLTLCAVRNQVDTIYDQSLQLQDMDEAKEKYAILNLNSDWKTVGQLQVKLIGAKGLAGKPNAYCTLELDNERVQTPGVRGGPDPEWNKTYLFNVTDVTSTLDLKVLSSSLVRSSFRQETIGKVTIPLLRIQNGEKRWYALKDRSKRNIAKGNCPRVLLEMTMIWNPVKATAKLFQPKEVKYVKKPPKFDVALIYSNMEFIRDTFCVLQQINESFKRLFEWENRELSFFAMVCWVFFWYWFTVWSAPLLMLIPFVYHWVLEQSRFSGEKAIVRLRIHGGSEDESGFSDVEKEKTLTGRIHDLPDLTLTITRSVEYMVSLAERLNNLVSFKVPFLSYIVMVILISSSVVLYIVPINYLLIAFGIYKFSRKYFNPERILNNDMLDFISRIPDNEILKVWKELNVPEPGQSLHRNGSMRVSKSSSNSIAA